MTRRECSFARSISPVESLCLLACLLIALSPATLSQERPAILQQGSSVAREIDAKQSHSFEFVLQADQIVTLSISAGDLNFALRLTGPDGDTLQEAMHRRYGTLTWQCVAPTQGRYRITISSLESSARPRAYQLRVEQIKTATRREKKSSQVAADYDRAEVLRFGWQSSELLRAAEGYQAVGEVWERQARLPEAAEAWQRVGEVHFIQGDYGGALRAYDRASRLSRRADDVPLSLTQLNNIGYVYVYLGDIKQASDLFEQVRAELGKVSVSPDSARKRIEAQLENNFGEVEYARGNLKQSLEFFARAFALWEEVGDRRGMALARLNAVYSHIDSGSVNEASAEIEQALRLWREVDDRQRVALTLTAQGTLQALLGDKYAALASHHEARDIFRRMGDKQGEAITSNGIGDVFGSLNLKQEAIDSYALALRLNHEIGNKDFEAVSNYYLGQVYRDSDDFPHALGYYEACLALSRQSGKSRMVAQARMDMAAIYTRQENFTTALHLYQQSLAFFKQISDLRRQAMTHHGLGELHHARGERDEAAREYQQGLELFQHIKDPQGEANSRYWLAKVMQEQGRLPEALREIEKSIEIIENQRARVLGQNWLSTYFASVRRYYELYVDILMQLHQQMPDRGLAALALQASERARARTLLELLNETRSEIRHGVNPALLTRERQLRQQLSAKATYQIQALNAARPEAEISEIELQLRQLNSEYDFVQAQIKSQSPAYAQLTRPSITTLAEIQAALKEDEGTVLLEYLVGDERSYLWLVSADGLIARELPGRPVLETLAREVYQALAARQPGQDEDPSHYQERYASAEDQFCTRAGRLSQLLLGPLEAVPNVKRLLVVADGGLHYIPFDALPLPAAGSTACKLGDDPPTYVPLLTSFEVVHLPSFSSLALLRRLNSSPSPSAQGIAIWADPVFESDDPRVTNKQPAPETPSQVREDFDTFRISKNQQTRGLGFDVHNSPPSRLLATQKEAMNITRLAPAGTVVLHTGFEANRESALEGDLSNYRILHFATHGLIDNQHPLLSGLLLSTIDEQGRSRDGLLQLHDIYGLRLNADLVVLSACQTGLGKELSGEGFVGLTQGFLYAGSRSVVASLWPVEDDTAATLMTNFYRAMLMEGDTPAVALRRAKLKMYRQPPHQSPYYWSAFILQGEFRAPPATRGNLLRPRCLWVALVVLAVMSWMFFWSRRRGRGTAPMSV
jgi:CHAT domain-containing protein/tetratricopeptide (TPR) repeat protein